jgi:hypothetical protein
MTRAFRGSQLSQLRLCPFAYERTYIAGDDGLPSPALQGGQAVHAVAAEMVRAIVAGGAIDVHEIAYRLVRGGHVEYADALAVATLLQEEIGQGIDVDPAAVFMIEERLEMPLELASGDTVVFYGTPDLVERRSRRVARISDWKTHFAPETQQQFEADPQLQRYALLIQHHYPAFEDFELVKHFVRYRNNSRRMTITAEQLEGVRLRLASEVEAAMAIEVTGDYLATPGAWCSVCRFTASCPRIRKYRDRGIDDLSVPDDDRARQLAGDVVALEAAVDALQRPLRRYLGDTHATGVVPLAGGEYGFGATDQREISLEQLREVFAAHKAEVPDSLYQVDLQALDKLLKRLPEGLVRAIGAAIVHSQGSRFAFRRTQPTQAPAAEAAAVTGALF